MGEGEQDIAITAMGSGCAAAGRHRGAQDDLDPANGLIQLSRLVQGIQARISERHDLTPVQARLLCVLAFGPRGMADLAQCFGVEKAALTGLVDRAERRGLVRRTPVPDDRRALRVTLTDTGQQAAAAVHAAATAELNQLLAPLTPRDREHFRNTMTKIITACATPTPPHPPPGTAPVQK
ncbi:MAG TPA: MarR family transcriptional regulator [Actinophytocola sp.]|uniref:MarR family winged helix-turn-helix transcriptional regulator n=1 Tax=Actinophytocola sp. TaxID=1872138 RepID=UPI002DBCD048|nr:MarR family transcriptional regulator [Actinophytocola sp.]HEU5473333.1 MarR family transcriptional regulator [Actinophytocola sp.]